MERLKTNQIREDFAGDSISVSWLKKLRALRYGTLFLSLNNSINFEVF